MEEIMNSKNDSKTYKLISKQRKTSNAHLQTLIVDGIERESTEQI